MSGVRKTARAAQDILDLAKYIADDNPTAAERLLDAIESKLSVLAAHPEWGMLRSELAIGLRSSHVGNYVLYYRLREYGIELLRVIHAARDVDALFE